MDVQIHSPAEPAVDSDGTFGGYSEIARMLSKQEPGRSRPYSRQLVERWYKHRDYNGFPQSHRVRTKTGTVKSLFKLSDVLRWHISYRIHHVDVPRDPPQEPPAGTYYAHPADTNEERPRGHPEEADIVSHYDENDLLY